MSDFTRDITGKRVLAHANHQLQWLLLLLIALAIPPVTVNIAVGQEAALMAQHPDSGAPPAPPAKQSNVAIAASTIEPAADDVALATTSAVDIAEVSDVPTGSSADDGALPAASVEPAAEISAASDFASDSLQTEIADTTTQTDPNTVRNLSVKPGMHSLMPEDSPAWITAASDYASSTHRITVSSLPTSNRDNVDEALDEPLLAAMYEYVDNQLFEDTAASDHLRQQISVNFIRKNLIDDSAGYVAELSTSTGPMYQKWVSLSISPQQQEQLRVWYREAKQRDRIAPLGMALFAALGLIGLTHLILRQRHGLPKHDPVTQSQLVALQTSGETKKRRCCSKMTVLGTLFCIFVLPALLLASLMVVRVERSSTHSRPIRISNSSDRVQQKVHEELLKHGVTFAPDIPQMPEMPQIPEMQAMDEMQQMTNEVRNNLPTVLHESGKEVKLKSGNQMIIIRTQ